MDRIMSTSIFILDQNFNANYVDIIFIWTFCLISPAAVFFLGGGIEHLVRRILLLLFLMERASLRFEPVTLSFLNCKWLKLEFFNQPKIELFECSSLFWLLV